MYLFFAGLSFLFAINTISFLKTNYKTTISVEAPATSTKNGDSQHHIRENTRRNTGNAASSQDDSATDDSQTNDTFISDEEKQSLPTEESSSSPTEKIPSPSPEEKRVDAIDNGTDTTETESASDTKKNKPSEVKPKPPIPPPYQPTGDYEKFPECRLYTTGVGNPFNMKYRPELFKALIEQIDSMTSLAAFYDKSASKFDTKQQAGQDLNYDLIVWDGYIPIKKTGTYTFLVALCGMNPLNGSRGAFALLVNGKALYVSDDDKTLLGALDADLKVGMNKLRFCVYASNPNGDIKPLVRYKLWNAVGDFREFTPANLSHKVEAEDW